MILMECMSQVPQLLNWQWESGIPKKCSLHFELVKGSHHVHQMKMKTLWRMENSDSFLATSLGILSGYEKVFGPAVATILADQESSLPHHIVPTLLWLNSERKQVIHVINCENTLLDCWLLTSIDSGAELHMSWTKCIIFNHILQKGFFFLLNSFWLYINKEWHLNQLASLKLLKLLVQPELEFDSAHVKWGVWNRPNRFIVLFCAPKNFAFIENHNNLGNLARPLTSPSTLIGD